jgi:hypothetical protein
MPRKTSNFVRVDRDFYPTPYKAVIPLLAHLPDNTSFVEPCAGDGRLSDHLNKHGHIPYFLGDIWPERNDITQCDATIITTPYMGADCIITNPPWDRDVLYPMIEHFRKFSPAWLLLPAPLMHTKKAAPYMAYCAKIVSVGRVKWIEESKGSGTQDAAWYLFEQAPCQTIFYGAALCGK